MSFKPDRLAFHLEKNKISLKQLSMDSGVGMVTLSNYLSGYTVPDELLISKLAFILGVPADYLTGESDAPNMSEPVSRIPILREPPANAGGVTTSPEVFGYISGHFNGRDFDNCYFLVATDDTMLYSKIGVGDKVLVAPCKQPKNGDIVALSVNKGPVIFRKICFCGTDIHLSTSCEAASTEIFDVTENDIHIFGSVTLAISYPL